MAASAMTTQSLSRMPVLHRLAAAKKTMGTTAARKALMILDNSQKVLGIELFAASQAMTFRDESKLGKAMSAVYKHIRKSVPAWEHDQISYIEMNKFDKMVKSAELNELVEETIGALK